MPRISSIIPHVVFPFLTYILLLCCLAAPVAFSQHVPVRDPLPAFGKPPGLEIKPIVTLEPRMHTGLGWFPTRLGDLNQDGFDDFAVASMLDTTFIYYGGKSIGTEPRYKLPGGSGGIAAGDFNGDGRMDLANTVYFTFDTARLGCVRIYFNNGSDPPFHEQPDQVLQGKYFNAMLGRGPGEPGFPGVVPADINRDGRDDLIMFTWLYDSVSVKPWHTVNIAFLGGERFHDGPDIVFDPQDFGDGHSHNYDPARIRKGDLNGDGYTDLMFEGYYNRVSGSQFRQWEVFLGHAGTNYRMPDYVIPIDEKDSPINGIRAKKFCLGDLNDDGCDEILCGDAVWWGNMPFVRGAPVLSTPIRVNDSLYNPDPTVFIWCYRAVKVGDMNGDGTKDVMVTWVAGLIPDGRVYHLYANGANGAWMYSRGSYGTEPIYVNLQDGVEDIGDVNGDGYDDVVMTGRPGDTPNNANIKLLILGGNATLASTETTPPDPTPTNISVSPNPVLPDAAGIRLTCTGNWSGNGVVRVYSMLGRLVASRDVPAGEASIEIDAQSLSRGCYYVLFTSDAGVAYAKFVKQ
jgi:hypothetical protein